jgi:2Fe-2S ferredoxin
MPTITYLETGGAHRSVSAIDGSTVMATAVQQGVHGIIGDCGGSLACASCHVYVEPPWAAVVGPAGDMEAEMLEGALAEVRPESRLSCQLTVSADLDGLVVRVAPEQM